MKKKTRDKRLLSILLACIMMISLVPTVAFADSAENCSNSPCTHVAAVGTTHYDTLQEAFENVATGDIVKLLCDVTLTDQVNIKKALNGLTFDGNGKKVTLATTTDPSQPGGSGFYFGNPNENLWCTGIKIKDLTIEGTARFAIFLSGGTVSEFTNVNISGRYLYAVNLYGTHGGTFTNCKISNSLNLGDDNEDGAAVWSNVAAENPVKLISSNLGVIGINTYGAANTLKPKIFVDKDSTVEVRTYDDGAVSHNQRLCVSPTSKGVVDVRVTSESGWIEAPYIATIGSAKYGTLADAITAAEDDDTIVLQANVSLANGITIPADKKIILELNGKQISGNTDSSNTYAVITNKGDLTIQDNTDTAKNGTGSGLITSYIHNPDTGDVPGYASNTITNHGTLTVKSGKIVNNGAGYACFAIDNQTNGNLFSPVLNIEGGKMEQMNAYTYAVRMFCNSSTNINAVNIKGGVISGGYGLWLQIPNANANRATLNISGGTINARDGFAFFTGGQGSGYNDYSNVSILISGGEINGTGVALQGAKADASFGSISIVGGEFEGFQTGVNNGGFISGGTFRNRPSDALLEEGYQGIENTDGTYGAESKYAAKIGSTKYSTFAEAVDAAQNGDVVVVLKNALIREPEGSNIAKKAIEIPEGKSVTIDLNGFTLTKDGTHGSWSEADTSAFVNKGTLTIQDSSAAKTGKIIGGGYTYCEGAVFKNYGTLNIKSGNFDAGVGTNGMGTTGHYLIYNKGTANIEGGTFFSDSIAEKGTALARNDNIMNISGGSFKQENFVVLRNGNNTAKMTISGDVKVEGERDRTIQANGEVVINGGEFIGALQIPEGGKLTMTDGMVTAGDNGFIYGAGTGAISGGTFSSEVPKIYCAPNFESVLNEDGTYDVVAHTHSYSTEWENNASEHWYECSCGDKSDTAAHTAGPAATETSAQTCTVCERVLAAKLTHAPMLVEGYEATTEAPGKKDYYHCDSCGRNYEDPTSLKEITGDVEEWRYIPMIIAIIEGNGQVWTKGTNVDLTFKSNANFADFTRVEVDDAEVAASNYTKSEGSTIVTLKASFLETLSVGEHKIVIVSANDVPEAKFTVKAAATGGNNGGDTTGENTNTGNDTNPDTGVTSPQTGDNSNMLLWVALLFVSLGGLTTTVVYKKRKTIKE